MTELEESVSLPHPRKLKILTTAAILFGNVSLGYFTNSISPALEDIRIKYGTSIDEISVIFTVELILYCIGAIACGFVSNYVNRQLIVIAALTFMALSMYIIPHCPTKLTLFVVGGILGFSAGFYDPSQVVWIIEIWQEKAGPFIQAQHLTFAIGSNIPSVLIAPFLNTAFGSKSRIYIPFSILGAITTLAAIFQILLFIFYRYYTPPMYVNEGSKETDTITSPHMVLDSSALKNTQKKSSTILGITIRKLKLMVITGIFLGAYQGMEVCTMQFIPIFGQYSNLQMTESASAYVLTGLTGMFTIGRAVGIITIFMVRPEFIICVNLALIVIANGILLIWANNNLTTFWVGSIILGAGYSTMYPSFCAFMEKHLVFTNAIGSIVCVTGSTLAAIYPLIVGHIIEKEAVVLTYVNFLSTGICLLSMAWGYKLVCKIKSRER